MVAVPPDDCCSLLVMVSLSPSLMRALLVASTVLTGDGSSGGVEYGRLNNPTGGGEPSDVGVRRLLLGNCKLD